MGTLIRIDFHGETATIQIPQRDYSKIVPNLLGIHTTANKIFSVGEMPEQVAGLDPRRWEQIKSEVVFQPIYDPGDFDSQVTELGLLLLARPTLFKQIGIRPFNRVTCLLTLPGYHSLPARTREFFEFNVLNNLKGWFISINGNRIGCDPWKWQLAENSLGWAPVTLYAVVFLAGFSPILDWLSSFEQLHPNLVIFLGLLITTALLFLNILIIDVLWMLTMPLLLPKRMARWMYYAKRTGGNKNRRPRLAFLADRILGKESEPWNDPGKMNSRSG